MRNRSWLIVAATLVLSSGCGKGPEGVDPGTTPTPTPTGQPTPSPTGTPAPNLPHLIPGPGEPGFDSALAALAERYDRQFHQLNAHPFGLSLDAYVTDAGHRQLVTDFLAQTDELDFLAFTTAQGTPLGPDDVIVDRGEHGDLGMFGGVAAAGDAYRYMDLRDSGADATDVEAARQDLLEAIDAYHVASEITGTPGTVARGVRRLDEPGPVPTVEPLPSTCPAPGNRGDTWRADGSGQHPDWIFIDNNSKDQLLGYVLALGAFWDAAAGDADVPDAIRGQLQADARALATSLREPVQVSPIAEAVDLVIRDWNDCITEHHDLNPRIIPSGGSYPIVVAPDSANLNGWNAMASLGIIRTLYHITGDADLGAYYYDELVGNRDYPGKMIGGNAPIKSMYVHGCVGNNCFTTNFSNVNMAFVGAWGLLRYETDPTLRQQYRQMLETQLWATGAPTDAQSMQQAFFNVMYSAFATGGNDAAATGAAATQLGQWPTPPYYSPVVTNCDAAELAAGSCIAIDGVTVIELDTVTDGGNKIAKDPLPRALRPPDNFEWRSDPRRLNGGGGFRLNPGGDFRAAYWFGRLLYANDTDTDTDANVSAVARPRP